MSAFHYPMCEIFPGKQQCVIVALMVVMHSMVDRQLLDTMIFLESMNLIHTGTMTDSFSDFPGMRHP